MGSKKTICDLGEPFLLTPVTFVGSIEKDTQELWVYNDETHTMVHRLIAYVPGLYRIFDEILINAADNKQRDPTMDSVKVEIDPKQKLISIYNNGDGVPVEIVEEGVYGPELMFSCLFASGNYPNYDRKTTGQFGLGAKLTNIFSTEFVIETADGKRLKTYKQVFSENMKRKTDPIVSGCKEGENWTKVLFKPDLARFNMTHLEDDVIALMKKRVVDLAGCLGKTVQVELNGRRVPVQTFEEYADLYPKRGPRFYERVNDRWEVCVGVSEGWFRQVSFVNGISTIEGGTHVDYVASQIANHVMTVVNGHYGIANIDVCDVKNHLWVFVNALIDSPYSFCQTNRETLTLDPSHFGSKCELCEEFLKKVAEKSGIVEHMLSLAKFKQSEGLRLFPMPDLRRSIPSMVDGLNPLKRKILFCAFKRNFVKQAIVAEFSYYVCEYFACHDDMQSVADTIIGMAQDFVGSNNINLLQPNSQFGTRITGGRDAGSARCIYTQLSPITRFLFPEVDDRLLDYLNEDGQSIEPTWYMPIIPMVLVNGSEATGTGWSSYVPSYNPRDIVGNLRHLLNGETMEPMCPWYRGFKGNIEKTASNTYTVTGIMKEVRKKLRIKELPIGRWAVDYLVFLRSLSKQTDSIIKGFRHYNDNRNIDIEVILSENSMLEKQEDLLKKLELTCTISTSNMHLFDPSGAIKKYDTPEQIIEEFFHLRLDFYAKRKEVQRKNLEMKISNLELQADRNKFQVELDELIKASPELLWLKDLDALEKQLDKLDQAEEERKKFLIRAKIEARKFLPKRAPIAPRKNDKKSNNAGVAETIRVSSASALETAENVTKMVKPKGKAGLKKAPVEKLDDDVPDLKTRHARLNEQPAATNFESSSNRQSCVLETEVAQVVARKKEPRAAVQKRKVTTISETSQSEDEIVNHEEIVAPGGVKKGWRKQLLEMPRQQRQLRKRKERGSYQQPQSV